jgi:arsenate reductase
MAEAFLNLSGKERVEAESAGIEPGKLNPLVVEAMREAGVDISTHPTKSVDSMIERRPCFDYVITVCDETSAERCPTFPGVAQRLHWGFRDPSTLTGARADKLAEVRKIRDEIRSKVEQWCEELFR